MILILFVGFSKQYDFYLTLFAELTIKSITSAIYMLEDEGTRGRSCVIQMSRFPLK
ncbi:hypothetical protein KSI01_05150 [Kurthia sibirica]|nr:hypothetical protein KSI01_05150 [Kurthia sibirica]